MAFPTPHSRINLANNEPGLKLTLSPSKLQGAKSPNKSSHQALALSLEHVLGTTTSSPNGFDCLRASRIFALCAGSAVVLTTLGDNDQVKQRFFRARPTAAATSSYNVSVTPTTPTRGPDHPNRPIGSVKDGGLGAFCSGAPYRDSGDSPSQKTWAARERIKAVTCVSLSPDGKFLAVGEVGNSSVQVYLFVTLTATDWLQSTHPDLFGRVRCPDRSSTLDYARAHFWGTMHCI